MAEGSIKENIEHDLKEKPNAEGSIISHTSVQPQVEDDHIKPTEEDWKVCREVADAIPRSAYLVILLELCERFTYYGLTGPFQNYIQHPHPPSYPAETPGALNKGQQVATALTTFFQFWCYITPIPGAMIADQYWGKYKTILVFAGIYFVGLIALTLTSIPAAIQNGAAFPGFIVSIIIIGVGTGGIKSNVSPLVAEQYQSKTPFIRVITRRNGSTERVIVTPQATYQKLFNMFYWGINVGSLSAIATTSLEKYVGFWSAYMLPLLMFIPGILVVLLGKNYYVQHPPRGSIFVEVARILKIAVKYGLEGAKPSVMRDVNPKLAEKFTWNDVFVDELRRTLRACAVFCWFPIYWLCYSQMTNNLVSMTATMQTGKVPNDIMQNINPLTLIIVIPLMDRVLYPFLRRCGIPMRPMLRITMGFIFAALAMAYCAAIQAVVYNSPPYYNFPTGNKNYVSAGLIVPAYILVGVSEVFASITGLEYAYKKAPISMKSLVMALFLFTNCVGSILGFALVSVAVDPKLTYMYAGIACAMGVCAPLFYIIHGKNDKTDVEDDAIGVDQAEEKQNPPNYNEKEYEYEHKA
ncbi:POT family-domain-containing protein [Radiomyces spectabilis]|uniref:POT family-domain-containing protein n=1 Tax=Radiomyces spectabilis TaxID=64574 RepID=UPI0022200C8F|nr:POT family-domain-containing protein [Radiomyces spectabilis]KAI8388535.1 POT family-domain-containing protein [Radiomyces spectabilis]